MLHPALARALATAHIEDLQRAAARRHTIRLARRVAHEPRVAATSIAVQRSASTQPRGLRAPRPDGMTRTETRSSSPMAMPIRRRRRSGPRAGIDRASSKERPASSLTRTSRRSE